jgi:hypothetical protein
LVSEKPQMRFIVEEVYKVDTNAESRDTQLLHWDDEVWLTVRFYYRDGDIRGAVFDTDDGKCFVVSGHENTTFDPVVWPVKLFSSNPFRSLAKAQLENVSPERV